MHHEKFLQQEVKPILKHFGIRLVMAVMIAVVVTEYGSIDSLFRRMHTLVFYQEYFSTLFITMVVMEIVHRGNTWLEQRHPWQQVLYRTVLQLLLGLALPAMVVFILASAYFAFYGISIHDTDYMVYAFPFILSLIVTLNALYIFVPHFLHAVSVGKTGDTSAIKIEDVHYSAFLLLHKGATSLPLPVDEVACIFIVDSNVIVRTFNKEDYLTTHSLDELEATLDPMKFCRLNRQLIGHINACKSYESLDYGKLLVNMEPAPDVATTVSQLKASMVKQWMEASQTC